MRSAGIRDLKNNLSRYLRRLKPGDSIAITDHGRVVAELRGPAVSAGSALTGRYASLMESGVVRPARMGDPLAGWPSARELKLPEGSAGRLIDEDRGG